MYQIIDIETENTGSDIMNDNKRIISVQIGDASHQKLYWADSPNPEWNLDAVKKEIESLLLQDCIFAGYNIHGFDVPLLKKFLDVVIPESNVFELSQVPQVDRLRRLKKKYRLEDVCSECGIEVTHKKKMNSKAETYKNKQEIREQALKSAKELARKKGWTLDFCYERTLNKIAGGIAILDSYLEFVKSGGSKNTLFYEYAIGDIISEYSLLQVVK